MKWSIRACAFSLILSALSACKDSTATGTPAPKLPDAITKVAGDAQSARFGTKLPTALQVKVTSAGSPLSGVSVVFTAGGGGTLSAASSMSAATTVTVSTDASGLASAQLTLNSTPGPSSVTAQVSSNSALSATFTETALPAVPTVLSISGGNNQTIAGGTTSTTALAVLLADEIGVPVAGATINFSVTGGSVSAALSSTKATTDASGIAKINLNATVIGGTVAVAASVGGSSSIPAVAFAETITPAPVSRIFRLCADTVPLVIGTVTIPRPKGVCASGTVTTLADVTGTTITVPFRSIQGSVTSWNDAATSSGVLEVSLSPTTVSLGTLSTFTMTRQDPVTVLGTAQLDVWTGKLNGSVLQITAAGNHGGAIGCNNVVATTLSQFIAPFIVVQSCNPTNLTGGLIASARVTGVFTADKLAIRLGFQYQTENAGGFSACYENSYPGSSTYFCIAPPQP